MTTKTKNNIIVSLIIIVMLGGAFGYYLYNKGPLDIKNSAALPIDATDLYSSFITDSTAAIKEYSGKVLLVKGQVNMVSFNQQKEKIILLKTATGEAYINCTMEEDPGNVKPNDPVNIKGICSGIGQGDEDLGIKGDVYLTRCFLIK